MIRTTTSNLDGKEIEKYLGVVVGEAILGAIFLRISLGLCAILLAGVRGLMRMS